MKENYSLQLTTDINKQMQQDLLGPFFEIFPFGKLSAIKSNKERDRVFNTENTILTMILTMTKEDKSLQNSVNIYSHIHDRNRFRIEELNKQIHEEYINPKQQRKAGRPRQSLGRIAKSKTREISEDTSAYSKARQRLAIESLDMVYLESKEFTGIKYPNTWKGMRVFITDGTYLQMQDTDLIREKFNSKDKIGYPRGLLQVLIEQGSGAIYNFALDSDRESELKLLSGMIKSIPEHSLLLADDLYNCFAIFALLKQQEIEIIVPGKRIRKYQVVEQISHGDEIVEINKSSNSKWLQGATSEVNVLQMRRIEYNSIIKEGEKVVLYTSLLDKSINKEEIIMKYESRWDIEISIREIKTIMDINVVRAKSPDTSYKEVITALIAYNYIRNIIAKITENSDFSPKTDIIQECYKNSKPILMDKLGRKYSRWSPGRRGYASQENAETCYSETVGATLYKKDKSWKISKI